MAGEANTPPAGGIDQKALEAAIAAAIAPLTVELKALAGNQKVFADTLAALPPAAEKGKEKEAGTGKDKEEPLTLAKIQELLDKRDEAKNALAAKSETKTALRSKVIGAKGLKELDPMLLAGLPDTDDEAVLTAAADKLVAVANKSGIKLADVGGVKKDGGDTSTAAANVPKQIGSGLSDGQQKLASSIVLPSAAA
jgi:hypothetical protein